MSNESEKLKRGKAYPLADRLPYQMAEDIFQRYAPPYTGSADNVFSRIDGRMYAKNRWIRDNVRATWTGEKRAPKKGEWYLSGSDIEAYRAPNDLGMIFHIAKIVRIETETVVKEIIHDITLDNSPAIKP